MTEKPPKPPTSWPDVAQTFLVLAAIIAVVWIIFR